MLESFPQATEYKFCELISVGLMLYLLLGLSLSTPVAMILQKWPKVTLGGTSRIKDEISFNIFLENLFFSKALFISFAFYGRGTGRRRGTFAGIVFPSTLTPT